MKPSETTRGREWLLQFELDDLPAASALIDLIRFVPGGEVIAGIRRTVEEMLIAHSIESPIAVVPIMSLEDMIPLSAGVLPVLPAVFTDYDPSQRHAGEPGSEALLAQLVREIRTAAGPSGLLPFPVTLDAMRAERARTVLFLTDYIGSGRQVLDYVASWQRHPSIRSWRSGHRVKFLVVAYAATTLGLSAVRNDANVDRVTVVEVVPSVSDLVLQTSGEKLEEICRNYARRGRLGGNPLGHGGAGALFASSFSVPNNLPAILIRQSKVWTPFFPGRSVPTAISDEIGAHRPAVDFATELSAARELRLAFRLSDETGLKRWEVLVATLALNLSSAEEIAHRLAIDVAEADRVLRSIHALNLRDSRSRVTTAGQGVLAMARRRTRAVSAGLEPGESPYYPRLTR
ncbi:hypothetical protein [Yonghaparkia sp. Root332]|uniref:phosphoribosyltransferase-like protein n=1 Tax=Yonghaparkia sp. Root332 TaxID=1736516 RepID=UPI0012E3DF65|nr:hypothetical protein [Yonghaparkia sp. Root332]